MNSFVHIIMYYYYAMTAVGYRIWWKRYITAIQLVRRVVIGTN